MMHFTLTGGNITLKKGNKELFGSMDDQNLSRLKFDDEWIIQCFWWKGRNLSGSLRPHSITFKRLSTTDEVTISGEFYSTYSIDISGQAAPNQRYSILMESGSSSVVINVNRDIFKDYIFTKVYSMRVSITITSASCVPVKVCRPKVPASVHLSELSSDLGRLLDHETSCFADVNLKCSAASFPAHKLILSARSPVFAAMFRNPMKENLENEVVIGDVDESSLRLMLRFVYTARLPDLTVSSASDLLVAADKYQLIDLKRLCCEFLKDNITLENVLRILSFGDLYDINLKSSAIDYICNTCKEFSAIEKTEEWVSLKRERSDLAVDILTSVVKAKEKKDKK